MNLSEGPSGSTQMPGRHACECQARKHDLVSNCVSCGRIVCAQEGSGPCLFCGSLVVTREEQEVISRRLFGSVDLEREADNSFLFSLHIRSK